MAIEPLGSVMSAQAQGTVTAKSAAPAEKPAEYSSANVQAVEKVDATTVVVENTQNGTQYSTGEQSGEQQASNEQIKKAVEQLNKKLLANSEAIFVFY